MPALNAQQTQDNYSASTTLGPVIDSSGGYLFVSGADVFAILSFGPIHSLDDTSVEVHIPAGCSGTLPAGVEGIRFRSYTPGIPATVTAVLFYHHEPAVTITLSNSSSVTPGNKILQTNQLTGTVGVATPLVGSALSCQAVAIKANNTNTGLVFVGNSSVTSAIGYELFAGDAVGFDVSDASKVYFTVANGSDGISWLVVG